jgi:3,4-dihydroxy 2-butanone 4-phosphate synthase/GTP cyclohydrolase II
VKFNSLESLIGDLSQGKMILLVDDENRENEGDLIFAADFVSPEKINFMAKNARGLICLALAPQIVDQLQLPLMVPEETNGSPNKTAFTVSIEAASGISTGISAADRSRTVQVAISPDCQPSDLSRPGHIFPLRARKGGVLERPGHTEASVDLMRLAGLREAAVICEVMNDDGSMARLPDLVKFAEQFQLKIGQIQDLIEFLKKQKLGNENGKENIKTHQKEVPLSSF